MNKQLANKLVSKKPLPRMRGLKNTAAHAVVGGGISGVTCVTGPACGATQAAGCTRASYNNCPND